MVKPKRNKLSQKRFNYKKSQSQWSKEQRYKAWMTHEMIDQDLNLLRAGSFKHALPPNEDVKLASEEEVTESDYHYNHDPFSDAQIDPPAEIWCLHCMDKYISDEAVWEIRKFGGKKPNKNDEPMLWCKDPECDGSGIGIDLLLMSETKVMYENNVRYLEEYKARKKVEEED